MKIENTQDEQIPGEMLNKAEGNLDYCQIDSEPKSEEATFRGLRNDSKAIVKCSSCVFSVLFDFSGSGLFIHLYVSYKYDILYTGYL